MRISWFLFAAVVAAPARVLSPVDNRHRDSRIEPLDFSGYASRAGAPLRLLAFNYDRGEHEVVRTFSSGTSSIGSPVRLYGWSSPDLLLGERYWRGSEVDCHGAGMTQFIVQEWSGSAWLNLKTFDDAGLDCLGDELSDGTDPYNAGVECYTGDTVLALTPSECAVVPAADPTPPTVVLRLTDTVSTTEQVTGGVGVAPVLAADPDRPIRIYADAFDAEGAAFVQIDGEVTVTCGGTWPAPGSRPTMTVRYYAEQPGATGASVEPSVGVAHDLDLRATAASLCGGLAPRSASGSFHATGWNFSDGEAATASASFAATF